MNLDGQGPPTAPGEEYTPPEYNAVALPQYLNTLRGMVFGGDPDRRTLDYRLRQFMACLHATELEEHVFAFDTRVTYLPFTDPSAFAAGVSVIPVGAAGDAYAGGVLPTPTASGRSFFSWTVVAESIP